MFQNLSQEKERRKTHRLICQALTGVALGVGILTMPALAANHIVNTTADIVDSADGLISLREAIIAANEDTSSGFILFDEVAVGQNPIFTLNSPLPSITNWSYPYGVLVNATALNSIQLSQPLTVGGGVLSIYGRTSGATVTNHIISDVNLEDSSSYLSLIGGQSWDVGDGNSGGDASLTGDVTLNGSYAQVNVTGGQGENYGIGGNANLNGNVIMNGHTNTFYLTGGNGGSTSNNGTGGDATLIGNVTMNGNGNQFFLNGGQGITSGATGGNANLTGNVTVNNDGWFSMSGSSTSGGTTSGETNLTGNIIVNDDGLFEVNGNVILGDNNSLGNVTLQGDIILNDRSNFNVTGFYRSYGINNSGGDIAMDGNKLNLNDNSIFTITGIVDGGSNNSNGNITLNYNEVVLNGNSYFEATGGQVGNGSNGGKTLINADATLNGESLLYLIGGHSSANPGGDINFTGDTMLNDNSGYYLIGGDGDNNNVGGNASILGNIALHNKSAFTLNGGDGDSFSNKSGGDAFITGGVALYNGSGFYLTAADGSGSSIGGDAFITGDVVLNDTSYFDLTSSFSYSGISGNGYIDGNVILNDNSSLFITSFGNGNSYTTGEVTVNDSSTLYSSGTTELNTDGGNATTSFSQNATFEPLLNLTNPSAYLLTVNNLILNDSKLKPGYSTSESTFTLGQTFNILHYNGDRTGEFDTISSPLTFDVNYGDGSDDNIALTLTGLDYTNQGGNENQRSLEKYLNLFQTIGQGQITLNQADLPFDLSNLTAQLGDFGTDILNRYIPDNIAAHNAQTYWNQKSFVDDILTNLRNTDNQTGGASNFALNRSLTLGQSDAQLSSLRNAMDTPIRFSGLNENALPHSGVWASYNGAHSHIDSDSGIGSNAWSSSSNGYTVGYTGGGEAFRWGAAAGHQESDLSFENIEASGAIAGYNAGLYAAWKGKSTFLNAILGYGDYDNDAYGTSSNTHFSTKALSAIVEVGKHIGNRKSGLTPYASLLWTRVKNEDVTDSDSGLSLRSGSNNVFTSALGLRYVNRMQDKSGSLKGGWEAGLAWLHQFGDTGFGVNAAYSSEVPGSFQTQTTPLDGNALQVHLGAYGRIYGNLIGFAGYKGTFGSSQKINAVNAGIGYQF